MSHIFIISIQFFYYYLFIYFKIRKLVLDVIKRYILELTVVVTIFRTIYGRNIVNIGTAAIVVFPLL